VDFYEVYEEHYDRVRNFILASVKNRWVADDLVQETFLRVLQNLSKIRDQTKISSWIFRIAANLCQDYFRSPSRKVLCFEDNPAGELPIESSLEKEFEQYQTSLLVQDLIKLLPENLRQVIYLCDIRRKVIRKPQIFWASPLKMLRSVCTGLENNSKPFWNKEGITP
jgi:RNA polymerase sigma-70 factor (ECF subfamily)